MSRSSISALPPSSSSGISDPRGDHPSLWRVAGDPLIPAIREGALSGFRVAVKDLFAVAGYAIGAGNPTWLHEAPVETDHAPAIRALLHAGADIVGIVQTAEFAYGLTGINQHYGTPPNPASPGRVPGGSSSGSASAVALGLADIGLGSDTAGSIRIPASYCGLCSLRPTHGMVPTAGSIGLAPSLDTVGWITRTPRLLNRVSDVLLPQRSAPPIRRLLLAVDLFDLVEPAVRDMLVDEAHEWAQQTGLPLHPVDSTCAAHLEEWAEAVGIIQAVEMWQTHGRWLREHAGAVSSLVADAIAAGEAIPEDYLEWAQETACRGRRLLAELVPPGTALVQPAAPTTPPPPEQAMSDLDLLTTTVMFVCAASMAGLPVLTLPGVRTSAGPIGLSLLAAAGSDRALSALVAELE